MPRRINFYYSPSGEITDEEYQYLADTAYDIRVNALKLISMCRWGHPGGTLSMGEAMAVLFGGGANLTPDNSGGKDRDFIIFSKAHSSPIYYSALYKFDFIDKDLFFRYGRVGGLEGHLSKDEPYGVDCNGGSLGLGLSYAVGLAAGLKLKQDYAHRVFCVTGDGELNEGQMWEAAMAASQYGLDNLIVLVDYNKVMAKGYVHEEINVAPLDEKWKAFGFEVQQCDGHNIKELCKALYRAKYINVNGRPNVIIMHTSKGRGVEACEFNYKWHTHAPNTEVANRFLESMAQAYEKKFEPIASAVKGNDLGLKGIIEEA